MANLKLVHSRDEEEESIAPDAKEVEAHKIVDRFLSADAALKNSVTKGDWDFIESCKVMAITIGKLGILHELEEKYFGGK